MKGLFKCQEKTAAEYKCCRGNCFNMQEVGLSDVVMAILAILYLPLLGYLPAPTVSLRSPIAVNAERIAKFFYNHPDDAFQVALSGTSNSLLHRIGSIVRNGSTLFALGTTSSQVAPSGTSNSLLHRIISIVRNGSKLFALGTTSSRVGSVETNALINAQQAVDNASGEEVMNVPVLSARVAYGFYMEVYSNLGFQILAFLFLFLFFFFFFRVLLSKGF